MSTNVRVRPARALAKVSVDSVQLVPIVETTNDVSVSGVSVAAEILSPRAKQRRAVRKKTTNDITSQTDRTPLLEYEQHLQAPPTPVPPAQEPAASVPLASAQSNERPTATAPIEAPPTPTITEPKTTSAPQTIAAGERFIERVPDIHQLFEQQDTNSFQNRIRPLTAPALPNLAIDIARAHNAMNIYNLESLYKQDWYDAMSIVRGLTHRPESDFISVQTFAPRSSANEPYVGGGDTSMSRYAAYGLQNLMTPFRQAFPNNGGGVPEQSQLGDGGRGDASIGAVQGTPAQSADASMGMPNDQPMVPPPPPSLTLEQRNNVINTTIAADPYVRTVTTGTKLADLQEKIDALHRQEILENSQLGVIEAEQMRRELRKAYAYNSPWLNDPLQATGVVALTPTYVAAKAEALSLVQSMCADTSLATVPESEWVRRRTRQRLPDGKPDTQWQTARMLFLRLVADVFVQRRMLVGQGVRHKDDLRRITSEINANLSQIRYTVGFDDRPGYKTFYIVTPRNDERRQPVYRRLSELRAEPYASVLGPQYNNMGVAPSILDNRNRITTRMLTES